MRSKPKTGKGCISLERNDRKGYVSKRMSFRTLIPYFYCEKNTEDKIPRDIHPLRVFGSNFLDWSADLSDQLLSCLISWADYLSLVLRLDQVDQYMAFPLPLPLGQSSESINLSGRLSFVVFFPKICLLFFGPTLSSTLGYQEIVFLSIFIFYFSIYHLSAVGWNWWSESC